MVVVDPVDIAAVDRVAVTRAVDPVADMPAVDPVVDTRWVAAAVDTRAVDRLDSVDPDSAVEWRPVDSEVRSNERSFAIQTVYI